MVLKKLESLSPGLVNAFSQESTSLLDFFLKTVGTSLAVWTGEKDLAKEVAFFFV